MFRLCIYLLLFSLLSACGERPAIDDQTYPWQIKITDSGNSQVFSIELDVTPLGHAARKLGKEYQAGLFENNKRELSLEVYFNEITRGGLSGKLILLLLTDDKLLQDFKRRSVKQKYQDSGVIKYTLSFEDLKAIERLTVTGLSYIPYVQLEKDMIEKRFGMPDRVIKSSDHLNHYIYGKKGLDIIQDDSGKELLQYVTPKKMQRLLEPLERVTSQ